MKFYIAMVAAALASCSSAIVLKDNWTEDPLHKFDEKHYDQNTVNSKWPESFGSVPRGDNPNCSSC